MTEKTVQISTTAVIVIIAGVVIAIKSTLEFAEKINRQRNNTMLFTLQTYASLTEDVMKKIVTKEGELDLAGTQLLNETVVMALKIAQGRKVKYKNFSKLIESHREYFTTRR